MHANQGFLEGIKGGGVQHLLLDLCTVRAPGHQEELLLLARLGRSLALVLVLVVIQPVPDHISKVRVNPSYSDKDPNAILVPKKHLIEVRDDRRFGSGCRP